MTVLLSITLAFINMYIDDRAIAIGLVTLFATAFGLEALFLHTKGENIKYVIICSAIILINFLITVKIRKIPAIERPSLKKINKFSLAALYAFCIYCNVDLVGMQSISGIIFTLFISAIVTLSFYYILREFFFAYLLLWIDYYFGTGMLYENKKVKTTVKLYRGFYRYFWVLKDEKIVLKPNHELIKTYYKDNKPGKYTKTMMIKRGLISKRLIITEVR